MSPGLQRATKFTFGQHCLSPVQNQFGIQPSLAYPLRNPTPRRLHGRKLSQVEQRVYNSEVKKSESDRQSRGQIAERLQATKVDRQREERALTPYVISRWYRPPEIILIEKSYDFKVDMWCLGCILGEMIFSTNSYKHLDISNRFLFRGDSCFPFSPVGAEEDADNTVSRSDQLKVIFDLLGHQNDKDLSFLSEDTSVTYAQSLVKKSSKSSFRELFPKTSKSLLRILHGLLEVNPYFRPSAKECLSDPYFNDVRNREMEVDAPFSIQQSVYQPGTYSYENDEHIKYSCHDYKVLLLQEIWLFKHKNPSTASSKLAFKHMNSHLSSRSRSTQFSKMNTSVSSKRQSTCSFVNFTTEAVNLPPINPRKA